MVDKIIGRQEEKLKIKKRITSGEAEFIAVYGRRRVGKTCLIRHVIESTKSKYIEVTGLKDGSLKDQLNIFITAVVETLNLEFSLARPASWMEAFKMLSSVILKHKKKPFVIFLDELPWLATPKSRLLQALDHFWNTKWSRYPHVKLIVCGSAASWILDNLISAAGGLHNRLTDSILLKPFDLKETIEFLSSRSISVSPKQALEMYLVMGGIPFYLKGIEKGRFAAQNIDQMCFTSKGLLYLEFERLYRSLFKYSEYYVAIIRIIAKYPEGIDQGVLSAQLSLSSTGGTLTKRLNELEEAGFIISFVPYGRAKKGVYYRIIDEYTLFYIRWIEPVSNRIKLGTSQGHYWQSKSQTPSWKSWSGYAFEAFCYKHIDKIVQAMNIHAGFEIGTWRYIPKSKDEKGVQIDILLDRSDGIINIIEIKYSQKPFRITKQYANQLGDKIDVFQEHQKTDKEIHLTMITLNGLFENAYSESLVSNTLCLDDFLS